MESQAKQLAATWINGNRKDAITEIAGQANVYQVALLAVLMFNELDDRDAQIFCQMLKNRID